MFPKAYLAQLYESTSVALSIPIFQSPPQFGHFSPENASLNKNFTLRSHNVNYETNAHKSAFLTGNFQNILYGQWYNYSNYR